LLDTPDSFNIEFEDWEYFAIIFDFFSFELFIGGSSGSSLFFKFFPENSECESIFLNDFNYYGLFWM
jgi:hypothetical protein